MEQWAIGTAQVSDSVPTAPVSECARIKSPTAAEFLGYVQRSEPVIIEGTLTNWSAIGGGEGGGGDGGGKGSSGSGSSGTGSGKGPTQGVRQGEIQAAKPSTQSSHGGDDQSDPQPHPSMRQ